MNFLLTSILFERVAFEGILWCVQFYLQDISRLIISRVFFFAQLFLLSNHIVVELEQLMSAYEFIISNESITVKTIPKDWNQEKKWIAV